MLKAISQVVLFLVTVGVCDLEYVFSNLVISANGRGRANVFLTLLLLLIPTLIFFHFLLNIFISSLAYSGGLGVR